MRKLFYILGFLLLVSVSATAQYSFTEAATSNVTIDSMYVITATAPATINFQSVDDYANTITVPNFATITIKCNYNWRISVRAQTANFSGSAGASSDMGCRTINIKKSTDVSYLQLKVTDQQLAIGNKGPTTTSGNTFDVSVNVDPGFDFNGGLYSIGVLYTVTKQ